MKTYIATLESISPYSQSRHYNDPPPANRESPKDYEVRTWRERCHADESGHIFIPPMAFKNCLSDVAKYMSEKIQGKGTSTYTKHFEAGVLILDSLKLPVKKNEVEGEWLFVPSDGKRGGGKRVEKCFPLIRSWSGEITIHVLDEIITQDVLMRHLKAAGNFVGIGRFRPRNNGFYGRFTVKSLTMA